MKKCLLFLSLLSISLQLSAQLKPTINWGKISDEELKMTLYDKDTSAAAVVLYDLTGIRYDINNGSILLTRSYSTRIKILKDEGKSLADVVVPYYVGGYGRDEAVERITAVAYNMEEGKVVKTQLSPKYIFRENVGGDRFVLKFSIPEVKVGTVIEYRYDFKSDLFYIVPDIKLQQSVPVVYAKATIAIPEFFAVNFNMKGYYKIDTEKKRESSPMGFALDVFTFQVRDMPSMSSVPYVWCMDDFASAVTSEFSAVQFPGAPRQNLATTWADVDVSLEKSGFGEYLRFANPFKEEVEAIKNSSDNDPTKVRNIHRLVMSKVKWNDQFRLFTHDLKGAVKTGSGSSAEVNFILISALRAAGYKADPILLNPRPLGRLPYASASYDAINAFVVMVTLSQGEVICLDATDRASDLNVMPTYLIVDRAKVYKPGDGDGWVNLSSLVPNKLSVEIKGKIDASGVITAQTSGKYSNMEAYFLNKRYQRVQSEDEFLESLENTHGIKVSDYDLSSREKYPLIEKISFTKQLTASADRIYVNNTILNFLPYNPFKESVRTYPIEFDYCTTIEVRCQFELPQGYKLNDMPENIVAVIPDGGAQYTMIFTKVGDTALRIDVSYSLDRLVFLADQYPDIRNFFAKIAESSAGMLTLEKI